MPDSLLQESLFPALFASLPPIVSLRGDSTLISPIALNDRLKFLKDTDRNMMKLLRAVMADSNLHIKDASDDFMKLLHGLNQTNRDIALLDYLNWYWELRLKLARIRSRLYHLDFDAESANTEFCKHRVKGVFISSLLKDAHQDVAIIEDEISQGHIDKAITWFLETSWKRLAIYSEHEVSDLSRFGFYIIRWQLAREARMPDSPQAVEYLDAVSDLILDDYQPLSTGGHHG